MVTFIYNLHWQPLVFENIRTLLIVYQILAEKQGGANLAARLLQVNKIPCLHVFIQQLSVSKPPVTKHKLIPSFPISATARTRLQGAS